MRISLISTYELGRQPFGLASPAAWLREAGFRVETADLAIDKFHQDIVEDSELVCFYVPMHTATKLAVEVLRKARESNPEILTCFYGLYAAMNADYLRSNGADFIISGEFESELVTLAQKIQSRSLNGESSDSLTSFRRLTFKTPHRQNLPNLSRYAHLTTDDRTLDKIVGYTQTTRGCKHKCRHCPIVPVYNGRFRLIQQEVVLNDIRQQIEAGAEHITFGDPDFLNGPGHVKPIIESLQAEFPNLTYDVTIKIEHLLDHADMLPLLRDTGCVLITSAVESIDNQVLKILDKGHSKEEFLKAVELCRSNELNLNPTFVTFTPWTTLDDYRSLLRLIHDQDLISNISPVQMAIRLLIPEGSKLLELPDTQEIIGDFNPSELVYEWEHPAPRMDHLYQKVSSIIKSKANSTDRYTLFEMVWDTVNEVSGMDIPLHNTHNHQKRTSIPYLNEPWYC